MLVGGWSRPQPPLKGELLTSCLARNAQAHGTTPYRLLALFWQRDPVWERDFDRDPAALRRAGPILGEKDWLADLAECLATDQAKVEAATLASWRSVLAGRNLSLGDTPLVLSAGVHHRARIRHGLQHCPACLAEKTPFFRKAWRLGFVVTCERHGAWLRDACPSCDAPVVPHRSMTPSLTDCHACGRSIMSQVGGLLPPAARLTTSELQGQMLRLLAGEGAGLPQPWQDRTGFDVLRTLLAVSGAMPVLARLRKAFELGELETAAARMRFEHARLSARVPWLETIAAWTRAWPSSFLDGAEAAGLTQRSFVRRRLPEVLGKQVTLLPPGEERDRTWVPVLEEPVLTRLRRNDPAAYRLLRAERILNAIGRAP